MKQPRPLTHDEIKASEAAFRGLPLDDKWTDSAKLVYEGILQALGSDASGPSVTADELPSSSIIEEPDLVSSEDTEALPDTSLMTPQEQEVEVELAPLMLQSRREAMDSGILKDVTPLAQSIGLEFSVGMTNPLWKQYITSSPDFTEEHIQSRLRDTLVAVRLRLASLKTPTPLVDVPVLLEFAPEPTPQLCLTFALFHKDPVEGDCLLLIHPGEVFATRQSFENN
jgi:hypothetical protein